MWVYLYEKCHICGLKVGVRIISYVGAHYALYMGIYGNVGTQVASEKVEDEQRLDT